MNIFKSYPNAKMFYKVGDKYFAHNDKSHAESYSRQSGIAIEEVKNPALTEKTSEKAEKVKKEKPSVNPENPAE